MKHQALKILYLLLTASTVLTGCSISRLKNLPPTYTFKKKTSFGIAALSVRCNLGKEKTSLYLYGNSKHYQMSFDCNSAKNALSKPELKIVRLPSGTYSIYNWAQIHDYKFFIDKKTSRSFNPIFFSIKPRQVAYLGQLQLIAESGENYYFKVINNAKNDIPKIKKYLPLIAKKDIHITPVRIASRKIIYH